MKKVIFTAEDDLVEKARAIAQSQGRSLNAACREWLLEFASSKDHSREYDELMKNL